MGGTCGSVLKKVVVTLHSDMCTISRDGAIINSSNTRITGFMSGHSVCISTTL
jgi:hypothetical protein